MVTVGKCGMAANFEHILLIYPINFHGGIVSKNCLFAFQLFIVCLLTNIIPRVTIFVFDYIEKWRITLIL